MRKIGRRDLLGTCQAGGLMRWLWVVPLCAAITCAEEPESATASELLEADRSFAEAVAANGTTGWVAAFAEDGMMFDGSRPVVGREAIRAHMGPAFDSGTFSLSWEPLDAEISIAGDLGYTHGRWESRSRNSDGSEVVRSGSYVSIWRRDADRNWRVVLDIGAADDPEDAELRQTGQ